MYGVVTITAFALLLAKDVVPGQSASVLDNNQYMDHIFRMAMPTEIYRSRLDLLPLPQFSDMAEDKVGIMRVNIRANYMNGNLTGLGKGNRVGDCSPTYYQYNNATFNCTITYEALSADYLAKIKYGRVPEKRAQATANFSYPLAIVEITTTRGSGAAILKHVQLVTLGRINTEISGLGPINDRVDKLLFSNFTRIVSNDVTTAFYMPYANALTNAVKMTVLPASMWY